MSPVFAFEEFHETPPVPQHATVTIVAQDPSVTVDGSILGAAVRIPAEHLEPGPRGARLYVVDYDLAQRQLVEPAWVNLETDPFEDADISTLLTDPRFRAVNVYAVAARTIAAFEAALGRRMGWAFGGHQLFLVPRAFADANAYYAPEDGAIYFGFDPRRQGDLQTALSHDVIAHETTHAILDGLRPRFAEPGLSDQPAFHEALADIVALLSVFSLPEVVSRLLDKRGTGPVRNQAMSLEALAEGALFGLAEELGDVRGGGLRRSVALEPSSAWRTDAVFAEVHRRGEVVVAAVMRAHLRMWLERLEALRRRGGADRARVAEEGAKVAEHLLRMVIRGVDYLPPVELEFEDVIDCILKADEVVAPDDAHGYRGALAKSFGDFDIVRPGDRSVDLSKSGGLGYERVRYALLRADSTEVSRFMWENADLLGITRRWRTHVEGVRPSVRTGPDGLVVGEVVVDYVQSLELTGAEARERMAVPEAVLGTDELQMWGGGVLVFDEFGRAKLHQTKSLDDWERQSRRLAYLANNDLRDSKGRFGFTLSTPRGQRFAVLHSTPVDAEEAWLP
jgi:hypothetical protein